MSRVKSIRRGSVGSMRAAAIRNSAANWSASRSCRTSPGWAFRCKIKCPSRYETLAHPGAIMYALRDRGHEPTPSPREPEFAPGCNQSRGRADRPGPIEPSPVTRFLLSNKA